MKQPLINFDWYELLINWSSDKSKIIYILIKKPHDVNNPLQILDIPPHTKIFLAISICVRTKRTSLYRIPLGPCDSAKAIVRWRQCDSAMAIVRYDSHCRHRTIAFALSPSHCGHRTIALSHYHYRIMTLSSSHYRTNSIALSHHHIVALWIITYNHDDPNCIP